MLRLLFFWNFVQCVIAYKPIVLWHGMGDSCCNPKSLGHVVSILKDKLPGVYIKSIQTGDTEEKDVRSGFLGNLHDQIATVCSELKQDEGLKDGFNAIGVSQVLWIE
jgi:palmitoyl-protein thioesterase